MGAISQEYLNNFLDEVQNYYDKKTLKTADDLRKPKNKNWKK